MRAPIDLDDIPLLRGDRPARGRMALQQDVCLQLIDHLPAMSVEFVAPKTVLAAPEAAKTLIETRLAVPAPYAPTIIRAA
jgi:hypothetical protein